MVMTGVTTARLQLLPGMLAGVPALWENTHCMRAITGRMRTLWRKL